MMEIPVQNFRFFLLLISLAFLACDSPETSDPVSTPFAEKKDGASPAPAPLSSLFDCVNEVGGVLVSAHRARNAGQADNSLETIESAIDHNIPLLEVDVRQSKDGVLLLRHDDDLSQSTNGNGRISQKNWHELEKLTLTWNPELKSRIPRLDEALKLARGKIVLQLDVKSKIDKTKLSELLESLNMADQVILITYHETQIESWLELLPDTMISFPLAVYRRNEMNRLSPERSLIFFHDERDNKLEANAELEDIETIYSSFKGTPSIDWQAAQTKNLALYRVLALAGAEVIATNRPLLVQKSLPKETGRGEACAETYFASAAK